MRYKFFPSLLLWSLILGANLAFGQDQKLTGEQIVAKHLEAVGGRAALAKLKTRIAIGTIKKESEPEAQMAVLSESPNRLSFFCGFRDYDLHMVFDGNKTLIRPVMPRNVSNMTDKYEEMLASGLMFNGISLYNLIANSAPGELKLEAKGLKKVGGKQAYVIQLKNQKGTTMRLYFDAENFMWVRTDYGKASVSAGLRDVGGNTRALNQAHDEGGSETTVDFYIETSDFRDVDGIKLPFKFIQVLTYPILLKSASATVVGVIREYRHNQTIDPKMFQ